MTVTDSTSSVYSTKEIMPIKPLRKFFCIRTFDRHSSVQQHRVSGSTALVLLQSLFRCRALDDANTVISLSPDWDKGYFRKGKILYQMKVRNTF